MRDPREASRRPPGPTLRESVRGVRDELEAAGVESPRVEAERLVAHAAGRERAELTLAGGERLTAAEAGRLAAALRRRVEGEPLQHIEGTVAFRELVLAADPRALVPRPETEQLVELVAAWAGGRAPLDAVLDVGTGSGAIALSLVAEGVADRAVGIDVSARALEQARRNRERAGLGPEAVELRPAARPAWRVLEPGERFDAIVSNPPYVSEPAWRSLSPEVREHEPREALEAGSDGLAVLREVILRAPEHLRPGGALFLEIGHDQGEAVRALLADAGGWERVAVRHDLAGRERFVRAVRS